MDLVLGLYDALLISPKRAKRLNALPGITGRLSRQKSKIELARAGCSVTTMTLDTWDIGLVARFENSTHDNPVLSGFKSLLVQHPKEIR